MKETVHLKAGDIEGEHLGDSVILEVAKMSSEQFVDIIMGEVHRLQRSRNEQD